MPAEAISQAEAKSNKLFYVVANVVIYRVEDGRCLLLKRAEQEKVHPGKWAMPGGKLEWNDFDLTKPSRVNGNVLDFENAIEKLLAREVMEEAGIAITGQLHFINDIFFVRPDGIPVILLKFAAEYASGEVKPEPGAFTDFAWVSVCEAESYDCIDGVQAEIAQTIELYR